MEQSSSHAAVHEDHDDGRVHAHISSAEFYWGIFGALVLLTFITVRVSYYDFGSFNIVVAMVIATMKASLVAAFFMHLRHDSLFNTLALLAAFLFLAIFILLTYDDMAKRGEVDPDYGGRVQLRSGQAAPGGLPATTTIVDMTAGEAPSEGAHEKEGAPQKKE